MNNYLDLIDYVTVDDLKLKLKMLSIKGGSSAKKADLARLLYAKLLEPVVMQTHFEKLSSDQQLALQEAVYNHYGHIDEFVFYKKYNKPYPKFDGWNSYRLEDNERLLEPFFFPEGRSCRATVIPADVLLSLKSQIPPPPEFTVKTFNSLANKSLYELTTEKYVESELNVLLNMIKQNKLKVSAKTGSPSKALLKKLASQLNEPYGVVENLDDTNLSSLKSFGWIQILRSSCWIKETHGDLQINVKKLSSEQAYFETVKQLFWDWKERSQQDEFRRINQVKGQTGKGQRYLTDPKMRRAACINTLIQCPKGEWVEFNEFLRLMAVSNNYYPVSNDPTYLYIGEHAYGMIESNVMIVNAYVRCLLMEYFATLGLIDIAYVSPMDTNDDYFDGEICDEYLSNYDGLNAIRLTPLGSYVLGIIDSFTDTFSTVNTRLNLFSGNKFIFNQLPTSNEKIFLSNYADKIAENTWQLSSEKILSYIENGNELDEIQNFLSTRDMQPFFPEETEYFFKELNKNKKAVKQEGYVLLLSCQTEDIAKKISSSPSMLKWCQRVGERQLIIPKAKENQFRKLIHELHYAMPI